MTSMPLSVLSAALRPGLEPARTRCFGNASVMMLGRNAAAPVRVRALCATARASAVPMSRGLRVNGSQRPATKTPSSRRVGQLSTAAAPQTRRRDYHVSASHTSSIADGPGVPPVAPPAAARNPTSPRELPLYGRTVFITGGSSGIGLAIAKRFLREGASRVMLVGRGRDKLRSAWAYLSDAIYDIKAEGGVMGPADEFTEEHRKAKSEDAIPGPLGADGIQSKDEGAPAQRRDDGTRNNNEEDDDNDTACRLRKPELEPQIEHHPYITLVQGDCSLEHFYGPVVKALLGRCDILVNSAGVSRPSLLCIAQAEKMREMNDTNLIGTMLACRSFLRKHIRDTHAERRRRVIQDGEPTQGEVEEMMKKHGIRRVPPATKDPVEKKEDKSIINISSLQAVQPLTGGVTYAASKAGTIALTKGIVNEMSDLIQPVKIRANVLVPGFVVTPMLHTLNEDFEWHAIKQIPAGRLGDPDEIADAAAFLATNRYCNGTVLNIDGGLGSRSPI